MKDKWLHMGLDGSRITSSQGYLQRDTGLDGPFFILIGKGTEEFGETLVFSPDCS